MGSINYNFRMDKELKERAFPIIESYGLTPAQAFKLFLNQIADTQTIPLSLDYKKKQPNAETLAAIQEAIENRKTGRLGKGYTDLNEMAHDIQEWQE